MKMIDTIAVSINGSKQKVIAFLKRETTKAVCFESEANKTAWFPKSMVNFTSDFYNSARVVVISKGVKSIMDDNKKQFFGAL
jgi:hypothetical protein